MANQAEDTLRSSTCEEAGMRRDRIELLRTRAASWVSEGVIPSQVLLAARRGRVFLHEAWGQARPDGQILRTDSVFPVSSISKVVVATLAMKLVEEGRLGLNRPLRFYLPELEGEGTEAILVHHLLTHTSGFDQTVVDRETVARIKQGFQSSAPAQNQHPQVEWLLGLRWSIPVSSPPGSRMLYADHNFLLLGEVLRRVSGRSLERLAREKLFDPVGMQDSWFEVPESVRARVVLRPPEAPQPLRLSAYYDGMDGELSQQIPWANGGMFSTAENLARFAQMFLDGGRVGGRRILAPATVTQMTRNQVKGVACEFRELVYREANWGLGWGLQGVDKWRYFGGDLFSPEVFNHGGFGGAYFWVDPRHEIVGVFLSVAMEVTEDWEQKTPADLFQNLVTGAVA